MYDIKNARIFVIARFCESKSWNRGKTRIYPSLRDEPKARRRAIHKPHCHTEGIARSISKNISKDSADNARQNRDISLSLNMTKSANRHSVIASERSERGNPYKKIDCHESLRDSRNDDSFTFPK